MSGAHDILLGQSSVVDNASGRCVPSFLKVGYVRGFAHVQFKFAARSSSKPTM